jgi:hypothetical protein
MDYRHHATDVIAGGILGSTIAIVIYHLYYPPLWDVRCQKPWAPRIPRQDVLLNGHGDAEDLEAEGLAVSRHHHNGGGAGMGGVGGPISPIEEDAQLGGARPSSSVLGSEHGGQRYAPGQHRNDGLSARMA